MGVLDDTETTVPQPKPHSVLHHSLVANDSEVLKFSAAATLQIVPRFTSRPTWKLDHRLIVSPYNDAKHLLDLTCLDTQSRLLAEALTAFKPIREDYALAGYTESFNWGVVIELLRDLSAAEGHRWAEQSFHVVVFRSRLRDGVDGSYLHDLDSHSHQEATQSGGLLKYWFGTKDANLQNLATCIWRSKEDASRGGKGPWHHRARLAARELYETIEFKTLQWKIEDDIRGWKIEDPA